MPIGGACLQPEQKGVPRADWIHQHPTVDVLDEAEAIFQDVLFSQFDLADTCAHRRRRQTLNKEKRACSRKSINVRQALSTYWNAYRTYTTHQAHKVAHRFHTNCDLRFRLQASATRTIRLRAMCLAILA